MNGRVPDLNAKAMPAYHMTDYKQDKNYNAQAIKNIHVQNPLNDLFFSDKNIEALQHGIRYTVYINSCQKWVIGNQSEDELKIVMRSIYLQYGKNQPFNILEQVKELNGKVLEYAVERVMNELSMNVKYRSDVASLPVPLDRSPNLSSRGTKVLELKEF